tara:strand:+ start:4609 stop:5889 length:1281 start_codon:yes stop_codon:yes gene_type:complete
MAEDYRSTAQRLSDGQERYANRVSQQRTTDEGGIGLLSTFLGPVKYGASTAIRSIDDVSNLIRGLSRLNKTGPARKLIANELAAAEAAKRLAQPTLANAAKRAAGLLPVAGAMQAGSGEGPQSVSSIRNIAIEPGVYGAIPGRPGTEVYAGVDNQRGLLDVDQPNGLAGKAADVGADLARDQNTIGSLSGLLGDLDYKGMLNQLFKTFQRPEMLTPGVNALTSFGMAGAGLRQAELVGAAAEQARADKLAGAEQVRADKFAIAGINNAPGAPEFDKTQTDLLLDITKGQGALDNLQKALELSLKSKLTGAGPQGIQGVSNLLAAFGIDPGVSDIKNYENRVARIKADLSASRIFGREMNRQELKILEKLVSDPGIFNTNTQLRNQLRSLTGSLEKTIGTKRRIIAAQFPNANIREIIEPPKSVFKE